MCPPPRTPITTDPDAPAAGTRPVLPTLLWVSAGVTGLILAPLWRGGYLLYRDAVSTPRSYVTDAALGVGDLPARAVPQDWFVAMASRVVDGGVVVIAILTLALVAAGVGYGRLAARALPESGRCGQVAAAVLAVWNPFVAERLLQGHWGLLVGYATLGWLVVAVADLARHRSPARWAAVGGLLAVAGLTPSGSILAAVVTGVAFAGCAAAGRRVAGHGIGGRALAGTAVLWVLSAVPWLTGAVLGAGSGISDAAAGVRAFGVRAEPFLGPLGSALGLGGIWNADAVPASRTIGWAAVATACLLVVFGVGAIAWWRGRAERGRAGGRDGERHAGTGPTRVPDGALAVLAAVTVLAVAASATPPGRWVLTQVVETVPGGGLLRDTQKFLALLMPFAGITAAAAVGALRRWVPSGFALAAVALLIAAPLPDLAWGVSGKLSTVRYPADWPAVASTVPPDDGAVALWPPDTVRRYPFADGPSLDPAARMLAAPVIESGALRVDGVLVDAPAARSVAVTTALATPGAAAELPRLGVGWVLVEQVAPGTGFDIPPALREMSPVYAGDDLRLYAVPSGEPHAASHDAPTGVRVTAWAAHLVWLSMIGAGLAAVIAASIGTRRRR